MDPMPRPPMNNDDVAVRQFRHSKWIAVAICGAGALLTPATMARTAVAVNDAAYNNHCRTCHSMKAGDNRLGPSLHNIYGAKAGAVSGYQNYSQALAGSGVIWDEATLDRFIAKPEQVIPNNNMKPYAGINDVAVRKEIISFLKSSGEPRSISVHPMPDIRSEVLCRRSSGQATS